MDEKVVGTLQQTSRRLRALIAQCGRLVMRVSLTAPDAGAAAAWLRAHDVQVGSLELNLWKPWGLVSYWPAGQVRPPPTPGAIVLPALPSSLTRLSVESLWEDGEREQVDVLVSSALQGRFSRLRALSLPELTVRPCLAALLPVLAALRQLTSLEVSFPGVASYEEDEFGTLADAEETDDGCGQLAAVHLPAALQQLRLAGGKPYHKHLTSRQPWLALQRLTALTRLTGDKLVVDGGMLPRRLRCLCIADVADVAPLLALATLTRLHLSDSNIGAHELRRLSSLRALREVGMCFYNWEGELWTEDGMYKPQCASAAFGALPLTSLTVGEGVLVRAECVARLRSCTQLRQLELCCCVVWDWEEPGAWCDQLVVALACMPALQQLSVMMAWEADSRVGVPAAAAADLAWAVARMPQLRACKLADVALGAAAVALAAATQLTSLRLSSCSVPGTMLAALRAWLPACEVDVD